MSSSCTWSWLYLAPRTIVSEAKAHSLQPSSSHESGSICRASYLRRRTAVSSVPTSKESAQAPVPSAKARSTMPWPRCTRCTSSSRAERAASASSESATMAVWSLSSSDAHSRHTRLAG